MIVTVTLMSCLTNTRITVLISEESKKISFFSGDFRFLTIFWERVTGWGPKSQDRFSFQDFKNYPRVTTYVLARFVIDHSRGVQGLSFHSSQSIRGTITEIRDERLSSLMQRQLLYY